MTISSVIPLNFRSVYDRVQSAVSAYEQEKRSVAGFTPYFSALRHLQAVVAKALPRLSSSHQIAWKQFSQQIQELDTRATRVFAQVAPGELQAAIEKKDFAAARSIMNSGMISQLPNGEHPLIFSMYRHFDPFVTWLLSKYPYLQTQKFHGASPLAHAGVLGNKQTQVDLLRALSGVQRDINVDSIEPASKQEMDAIEECIDGLRFVLAAASPDELALAAFYGDTQKIQKFIDEVRQQEKSSRTKQSPEGGAFVSKLNALDSALQMSLLHYAILGEQPEIVAQLLHAGADPNVCGSNGLTPMHFAVMRNYPDIVDLLHRSHARIDSVDCWMRTPLHYAACSENFALIHYLVAKGADLFTTCPDNKEPASPFALLLSRAQEDARTQNPFNDTKFTQLSSLIKYSASLLSASVECVTRETHPIFSKLCELVFLYTGAWAASCDSATLFDANNSLGLFEANSDVGKVMSVFAGLSKSSLSRLMTPLFILFPPAQIINVAVSGNNLLNALSTSWGYRKLKTEWKDSFCYFIHFLGAGASLLASLYYQNLVACNFDPYAVPECSNGWYDNDEESSSTCKALKTEDFLSSSLSPHFNEERFESCIKKLGIPGIQKLSADYCPRHAQFMLGLPSTADYDPLYTSTSGFKVSKGAFEGLINRVFQKAEEEGKADCSFDPYAQQECKQGWIEAATGTDKEKAKANCVSQFNEPEKHKLSPEVCANHRQFLFGRRDVDPSKQELHTLQRLAHPDLNGGTEGTTYLFRILQAWKEKHFPKDSTT